MLRFSLHYDYFSSLSEIASFTRDVWVLGKMLLSNEGVNAVEFTQKLQNGQEWPWRALWRQRGKETGHLSSAAAYTLPSRALLRTVPGGEVRLWRVTTALGKGKTASSLLWFCCHSEEGRGGRLSHLPGEGCLAVKGAKWPISVPHVSFSSLPYQGRFGKKRCSPSISWNAKIFFIEDCCM